MKKFDVAIAGGGVIGGAIALELARAGLSVAVFDRQQPGQEASWASAGIISPAPESPSMIVTVPLAKASVSLYPEFVAQVEEISGKSVGFRRAEPLRAEDARELEPALSEEVEAAVLRPDEASVDNRALTGAILEAAQRSGAEIFSGNGAKAIWRAGNRCAGLVLQNEKVEAKWTIIAAGCFSATIEGIAPYAPVRPAKGQMVALRADDVKIERVLWSDKIYLVPRNDGRILAGATVEHAGFDKRVTAGGIERILAAAIDLAPGLANACIEETWAGLRPDSPDHLPILGPTDIDGLLMATGHFRSGILLTPITARLIREWITEQRVSVDWDRLSPLRFADAASDAARHAPA